MATRTRFALISAFISSMVVLWLLSQPVKTSPALLTTAFTDGILHVGVDPSYHPFAQDDNGHLVGFDIDLTQAIGDQLGLSVQWVALSYDGLYDALYTGRVNVLASVLVDPARQDTILYTPSYTDTGWVLVSPSMRPVMTWQALGGLQLAVEFGSDGDAQARGWQRRTRPFTILPYELPQHALQSLRLGIADAALVSSLTLSLSSETDVSYTFITHEPLALAVRATEPTLAYLLTQALNTLESDGTLESLRRRWLGHSDYARGN